MEIDDARSGSQLTRSKTDEDGGSLLKSRSPPTIRNTVGAIKPAPQLLPPLQALANVTAESSQKSSYASDSSGATVASKTMGTGFNGNMYEAIQRTVPNTKLTIWIHGVETEKWYKNAHTFLKQQHILNLILEKGI